MSDAIKGGETDVVSIDTRLPSQYSIADQIKWACNIRLNLGYELRGAITLEHEVILMFQPSSKPQEG